MDVQLVWLQAQVVSFHRELMNEGHVVRGFWRVKGSSSAHREGKKHRLLTLLHALSSSIDSNDDGILRCSCCFDRYI